jgi:hypothetical protein
MVMQKVLAEPAMAIEAEKNWGKGASLSPLPL